MKLKIAAIALTAVAAPAFAQMEENQIDMSQVPQAAMEAAQSHAQGVEFDKVLMDDDEGTDTYEFSGTMDDGKILEVDVLADGTVEEVEEQIDMSAVPQNVQDTLNSELSGFQPAFIEKSTRDDGQTVVYEFEGTHDGQEIDVEINEDGSGFTQVEDSEA